MLSAPYVLQNSPQFIVQGFEVSTPRKPILGTDEGQKVPPQPLLSCFGFWKTHFWPLKRVMLNCFTTPCSISSWYTWTPVSPLSCKNEDGFPPDGTPPTKPWHRKGGGLPAPSECFPSPHGTFEHKSFSGGCTASRWWRFSRLWRGCFNAHSRRATGGDTLLLSVGSPSKQEEGCVPLNGSASSCVDRPWWGMTLIWLICSALMKWSSVSRADFGESAPTLFW